MTVALKYCGLTRPEDAAVAGELGAAYVGVIFAGGPRMLSAAFARQVLDAAGAGVLRVGVFGAQPPEDLARAADEARLDIVQLHADPTPDDVATARAATSCEVWGAVRISAREPAPDWRSLSGAADGVVLDAKVAGALGGTGASFDWPAAAVSVASQRSSLLILAGGLNAANVARAVGALSPDVVDVSSGVEASTGVKDHGRMRAFADAARGGGR
ncbi:MAG: phosphoribosylanthranilate isomerase [Gemmatimonadaceae bacterium]